jgi:hypothetical protein
MGGGDSMTEEEGTFKVEGERAISDQISATRRQEKKRLKS